MNHRLTVRLTRWQLMVRLLTKASMMLRFWVDRSFQGLESEPHG